MLSIGIRRERMSMMMIGVGMRGAAAAIASDGWTVGRVGSGLLQMQRAMCFRRTTITGGGMIGIMGLSRRGVRVEAMTMAIGGEMRETSKMAIRGETREII